MTGFGQWNVSGAKSLKNWPCPRQHTPAPLTHWGYGSQRGCMDSVSIRQEEFRIPLNAREKDALLHEQEINFYV